MKLKDIIYPPRCICCYEVVGHNTLVCGKCIKDFESRKNYIDFHAIDFDCTSLYKYEGSVKGVITCIKFKHSLTICKKVGNLLVEEAKRLHSDTPFDLVTYVPMTRKATAKRRFNQSEVFARIISKKLGLKFRKNVLIKIRETRPQKSLKAAERRTNLKGAFKVIKDVEGKSVLLVDDIVTTGATLKENAKMLYKAGARRVTAITFAKT